MCKTHKNQDHAYKDIEFQEAHAETKHSISLLFLSLFNVHSVC